MVRAWNERVTIPTYEVGKPEKNPIFLEKRVYQGSSGAVYPYPVIESICDEKHDKKYDAVYIENEYIKVMILPELGGRVQMAYDKIRKRHFVYYNHVIKPALVGLAGPWISGGIEFNWPQHHRPSTFMPVDTAIEEHSDGSVTVWVSEMERMFHQKGMAGFTLRPGCAYLEISGVLYNRTDMPQTFLWWANPAVAVNDHYQSVFPPDINAVFDHGKRAVSSFPVATGTYYKMDYSAGVDISNYKNISVPTSYMGVNSRFDFEGGYENDTRAGMLHVASHHVSPGKKQWTWGNGDFGRAWDRNLTDDDGPYIELMAGVYTENQPDFSWLQPYEEKAFTQYFLPYRELGIVKNASKDFLLNIQRGEGGDEVTFKVFATSAREVTVELRGDDGTVLYSHRTKVSPEKIFERTVAVPGRELEELTLEIRENGRAALSWHAEPDEVRPVPDPAEAALRPEQIKTCEQLYFTGLHLEQYRHATYNPVEYYEEALRRDPADVRCNNALGLWYLRRGRFELAEKHLARAVAVSMKRNPNPYDGEPIYNLGLALKYQGRYDEAYARFYKSTWNGAWQDAGYFECAKISVMQERLSDALHELDRSLVRNWHNHKARALKATVLRRSGQGEQALAFIEESLRFDRFNYGCLYEKYLLTGERSVLESMKRLMRRDAHNYDEIALDYCAAGCWSEALSLWEVALAEGACSPMSWYYMGWCALQQGDASRACSLFAEGGSHSPDCCFPNRLEAVLALRAAIATRPGDARAPYFLGNLFYDKRQYALARQAWEDSARLDEKFPTVWRNLALVYFNKCGDAARAVECMERAFALDTADSRVLMELDQLYKRLRYPHGRRLALLERYPETVSRRDDLVLEHVTLLNQLGEYDRARTLLDSRVFHPWEGGEGKVSAQYQFCRVEMAKRALAEGRTQEAVALLEACLEYPPHLGEGKLYGAQENDFHYFLGVACELSGNHARACDHWRRATAGPTEPAAALYYNDAKPDKIFYAGLAWRALGEEANARRLFNRLLDYGKQHLHDTVTMDYFAVSLPDLLIWEDDLQVRNQIHCKYMMALGYAGLGDGKHADRYLAEAAKLDINHQGIQAFESTRSNAAWLGRP